MRRSAAAVFVVAAAALTLLAACGDPSPPGGAAAAADASGTQETAGAVDATKSDADAGSEVGPDVEVLDLEPEAIGFSDTARVEPDVDWSDLLDPSDTQVPEPDVPPQGPVGQLYAHTSDTLYRLDLALKGIVEVGKFSFDKQKGLVTDIAVDEGGQLYAITHEDLFKCAIANAKCTWLADLPSEFNGLTFVEKGTVDPVQDALIGISEAGAWTHVQFSGGKVKLVKLGQYPSGWLSSGDAFSVFGIGCYATLKGKGNSDTLVKVDPKNGKILEFVGETGVSKLFGLAWWQGVLYGFSSSGGVYSLDVQTGKATPVQGLMVPKGVAWWGAGVSTRANGK
jgi:hypothetical protein